MPETTSGAETGPTRPAAAFWTAQPAFGKVLAITLLLVTAISVLLAWQWGIYEVSEEGRILERVQAVLLAVSAAVLVTAALKAGVAPRMLFAGMATVALIIFLRELGMESGSAIDNLLGSTPGRVGQTLLFAGVGVAYVVMRPHYLPEIGRYLLSRQGRYILLVILLILLADGVEKLDKFDIWQPPVGYYTYKFIEEILELAAYVILVFVSLFALRHGTGEAQAGGAEQENQATVP